MKALRFPLMLVGMVVGAFGLGWVVTGAVLTRRWSRR